MNSNTVGILPPGKMTEDAERQRERIEVALRPGIVKEIQQRFGMECPHCGDFGIPHYGMKFEFTEENLTERKLTVRIEWWIDTDQGRRKFEHFAEIPYRLPMLH